MGERKRIEALLTKAREKVNESDKLFELSKKIYINLRSTLDEEINELETKLKRTWSP